MHLQDGLTVFCRRQIDQNNSVEAAGTKESLVDQPWSVRRSNDDGNALTSFSLFSCCLPKPQIIHALQQSARQFAASVIFALYKEGLKFVDEDDRRGFFPRSQEGSFDESLARANFRLHDFAEVECDESATAGQTSLVASENS